jgi:protein O-mannosyl-transferase
LALFSIFCVLKPILHAVGKKQCGLVFVLCLLLFGLLLWTYFPAVRGDFIDIDDGAFVIRNPFLALTPANVIWAFGHSFNANWLPVTLLSFMLDYRLYGLQPWGFHLTNVLLHALNGVLVFLVLRRMTGSTWRSLTVAVLFSVHPLRVESVAWISERKDVLSLFFWMLTLWAYAGYAPGRAGTELAFRTPDSRFATRNYALALFFYALALMSKPMVVTLPFVLLLLDYWPLERWPQKRFPGLLLEKGPFFLLSAIVSVITFFTQKNASMLDPVFTGLSVSFAERLENALVSYGRYLGKLFWPVDLSASYPYPDRWPAHLILFAGLLVLAIAVLAFALRRRSPYLLIGWLWYLGTLVPVLGLVSVGAQAMADRYSYIPSLGILIALVWGAFQLTGGRRSRSIVLGAIGTTLALSCLGLTRHQIGYWKDGVTVWQRAVTITENDYAAHNWLGCALYAQGQYDEAIQEFQKASTLNPGFAEIYCSLGQAYTALGRMDEAIAACQKALKIRPGFVVAHMSLGSLLLNAGRVDDALFHFRATAQLDPNLAAAQKCLGQAFAAKGQWSEAIASYQRAIAIEPDLAEAWLGLGLASLRVERFDDALTAFQNALSLQPGDSAARNNLGYVLLRTRRLDEAISQFRAALQQRPDNAEIHNNLGSALLAKGLTNAAVSEFQEALRLKPGYAAAIRNLAFALPPEEKNTSSSTNSLSP